MLENTLYISYLIAQKQKKRVNYDSTDNTLPMLFTEEHDPALALQEAYIDQFLAKQSFAKIQASFIETPENSRTGKWPYLSKAILACQELGATLLIANVGTLTNNPVFTNLLLNSSIKFYCCDQPFITPPILEALSKHAQVQKKLHGELIREGLKMTSAKSGNPNAAAVISKVNKPKIDTAIIFAFLLQPLIINYRRQGYSQRQMVKMLNDEGFTAPEGGKWVLSQLQKVLDRVKLNEIATSLSPFITDLRSQNFSFAEIAEKLNVKNIPPMKRNTWDEAQVKKLFERIQQIRDITLINRFVLDFLPILHIYRHRGMTAMEMLKEFNQAGITVKEQSTVAA